MLEPGTQYRFQLLAFTQAGDGPQTPMLETETHESAASRRARLQSAHDLNQHGRVSKLLDATTSSSTTEDPGDAAAKPTANVARAHSTAAATPGVVRATPAGAREAIPSFGAQGLHASGAAPARRPGHQADPSHVYSLSANKPNWSELAKLRKGSTADAAPADAVQEPTPRYSHPGSTSAARQRASLTDRFMTTVSLRAKGEEVRDSWSVTPPVSPPASPEKDQGSPAPTKAPQDPAAAAQQTLRQTASPARKASKGNWLTKTPAPPTPKHDDDDLWNESAVASILSNLGRPPEQKPSPIKGSKRLITRAEMTGIPDNVVAKVNMAPARSASAHCGKHSTTAAWAHAADAGAPRDGVELFPRARAVVCPPHVSDCCGGVCTWWGTGAARVAGECGIAGCAYVFRSSKGCVE